MRFLPSLVSKAVAALLRVSYKKPQEPLMARLRVKVSWIINLALGLAIINQVYTCSYTRFVAFKWLQPTPRAQNNVAPDTFYHCYKELHAAPVVSITTHQPSGDCRNSCFHTRRPNTMYTVILSKTSLAVASLLAILFVKEA